MGNTFRHLTGKLVTTQTLVLNTDIGTGLVATPWKTGGNNPCYWQTQGELSNVLLFCNSKPYSRGLI